MEGNAYKKLAMRTTRNEWRGRQLWEQKIHAVTGLCSEAGEVAGIIQKLYQGHRIEKDHLKKELGDVLWFVAECCDAWGIDFDDVMQSNINKLKKRYPDGFEEQRSLHRNENDV